MASNLPASKSGLYADPREDWLALHSEDVIDPARRIVDPHHHLWDRGGQRYLIDELAPGRRGRIRVRRGGDERQRRLRQCCDLRRHRRPRQPHAGRGRAEVLEAEIAAGNGRFRGIRHSSPWDADPDVAGMYALRPKGLLLDPTFRKGFACLAPLGLSYDSWLFHPQIGELADLARAFPDTRIVLDHCGGPIGVGGYANRREEIFEAWKASIRDIAGCPNVVVKLGGLAMCLLGYDFHQRPRPPSSEQAAAAWRPYIETCIEAFGPSRAMFESNFPPDKGQCSYQVIFNAFKRIAAQYSEPEKTALFSQTAADVYRLKLG